LRSLAHAFDEAGILWCLLRVPANLGKPAGGDVDLLIAYKDLDIIHRMLKQLGFLARGGGLHELFVTYHAPSDCWVWLDVATELSFGSGYGLRTGCATALLSRRQRDGEVFMPAPNDEFWSLLLHCLLDKAAIALHHRLRLGELASLAHPTGELAQVFASITPDLWSPERAVRAIIRREWETLECLASMLRESKKLTGLFHTIVRTFRRAQRRLNRIFRLFADRGVSVGLLGPDGAGKSTLASTIPTSFVFPARSIYMGLTGGFLVHADKLQFSFLVIPGRLCILWGRYLRAQYHKVRGRLVLFDRYIYDGLVRPREPLNWARRLRRWLESHACPAPDLVIMLDAPGEVMCQRKAKGRHSSQELESARQQFLALQQRLPRLQIIDATRSKDEVRAEVLGRIWQVYVTR